MSTSTQPKPHRVPNWLRATLIFLGMAVAGGIFGYSIARVSDWLGFLPELDLRRNEALLLLAALPFVWFFVVLLHELGHLLCGIAVGFKPYVLIVGPLRLRWIAGELRVELNRNLNLMGGLASAIPPDDRTLVRGLPLMVAGGPLASLLTGVLGLLAAGRLQGFAAALALLIGFLGLVITLVTLIPLRNGGFFTDGARLLMLLRGGLQAARWGASTMLLNAALAGQLGKVDPSLVARAASLRDGTPDAVSGAFLAYSYHLVRGEYAQAGAELDYTLAQLEAYPAGARAPIRVEAAYFLARHRADPETARALLDANKKAPGVEAFSRHRAEAALHLAENRRADALAAVQAARAALEQARLGVIADDEFALLADLEAAAG